MKLNYTYLPAFILLLFTWHLPIDLSGQKNEKLTFRSFDITDGLSQNTVYDIEKSQNGFLWLATIDGLNRFDGHLFKQYKPLQSETKLLGSIFYHLEMISERILLVGTAKGLLCYDIQNSKFFLPDSIFTNLKLPELSKIDDLTILDSLLYISQENRVYRYDFRAKKLSRIGSNLMDNQDYKFVKDKEGELYVYGSASLWKIKAERLIPIRINGLGQKENDILQMIFTARSNYLAIKGKGLVRFSFMDENSIQLFKSDIKIEGSVAELHLNQENYLYIGTRDRGLYRYDLHKKELQKSATDKSISGLKSDFILSIFQDQDNNIYLGTSGGGFAINLDRFSSFLRIKPSLLNPKVRKDDMVLSIQTNEEGLIFMGGLSEGIKIYDPIENSLMVASTNELPKEAMNIYDFHFQDEDVYAASWHGLLKYSPSNNVFDHITNTPVNSEKLYCLLAKSDEGLFLGGENGLAYFDFNTGLISSVKISSKLDIKNIIIRHMDYWDENHLLLATTNHNVLLLNLKTKSLVTFPDLISYASSARHFYIDSFSLYIATDEGLLKLDKQTFKLTNSWSKENGLVNDFVYAVSKSSEGLIWISTNKGLISIDEKLEQVVNYSLIDGIQGYEFNTASVCKDKTGSLLFGGTSGFNIIPSNVKSQTNKPRSPIVSEININGISKLDNDWLSSSRSYSFPYDSNDLSIQYSSTDHWTAKPRYWYKLEGINNDWVENDSKTSIQYSELPSGTYTFLVKAEIENNFSEVNDLLQIIIRPAIWNTLWFKICLVALILYILYRINRFLVKQKSKELENKNKLMVLENKMLQYRMNPHFIFNTLNSIKHHAIFKEKEDTGVYITDFSQVIRGILEYNDKEIISLKDDIEWIRSYVEIENKRMKSPFSYSLEIDPELDLDQYSIPPLLLQPFIENAIWHGLLHKAGEKNLLIQYKKLEDGLKIIVEDNGVGRKASVLFNNQSIRKKSSLGIKITNSRIDQINKLKNYHINVELTDLHQNEKASGTKVSLTIITKT